MRGGHLPELDQWCTARVGPRAWVAGTYRRIERGRGPFGYGESSPHTQIARPWTDSPAEPAAVDVPAGGSRWLSTAVMALRTVDQGAHEAQCG